nr:putative ribonuclease H-like domain-containing protein [Tanacetum cinerariifolium]
MEDSEWKEVKSRKNKLLFDRLGFPLNRKNQLIEFGKDTVSVYVSNFSSHLTVRKLWNICGKMGKIINVYVSKHKNKLGQMFAICRFDRKDDVKPFLADVKRHDSHVFKLIDRGDANSKSYVNMVKSQHSKERKLIEIILFIIDSGCSKYMTRNLKLLRNVTIKRVYYIEGLNHNLFSVSQFCDADLEVAFWKSTCYIRDLNGNGLLTDHLCSSCELGKAKRKSFKTKTTPSSKRRLPILHMDLCGPMRVENFNGKKYVLVIVDDYSRYTWTHFLRSKYETPEVLIDFFKLVQRGLHAQVRTVQTDKGIKFLDKTLHSYFAQEGIEHQTSTTRTPEQNDVIKRWNRALVEAAQKMLSAAKVPLFFWDEAIAT